MKYDVIREKKGEHEKMQKKNALATVLFIALLSVPALTLLPMVTADVFMPPGPPTDMSEWIYQGLHVIDLQTMEPIGYKYTDGPHYDPLTQTEYPKVHWEYPEIEGPTVIPFSTWVMVFGHIPGVVVSPDQTPPPVVMVIEWNGVPYAVTLEAPGPVGYQYPPEKYGDPVPYVPAGVRDLYPCVETIYPWVYPTNGGPDGSWKYAYYNVWNGDFDGGDGPLPFGLYFWYIFHPNAGDWIAFNCGGRTKHPPTYDITAHLEYSTSTIWLNHKCFDVRLLEVHKEIEPDNINFPDIEYRLRPTEDARVLLEAPWINYNDHLLAAQSDSLFVMRSYLKFDVSGLNPEAIDSASLQMFCYNEFGGVLPVEITQTTDGWDETTLTWDNAPAPDSVVATTWVDGAGRYYEWESFDLTEYVRTQALLFGDDTVSLVVKLPDDLTDRPLTRYKYFWSKDSADNWPVLVVKLRSPLDEAFEISNILTIKNVGKVPAPGIDFIESFPTEKDTAIIPKWDTATVKIFDSDPYDMYVGRHIYATPLALREGLIENGWPFYMPEPYDVLYPGETMVISMEASVNVDEYWSGSFVIDAMVSSCFIAPWKYPRSFDILTIGTDRTQTVTVSPIDQEPPVPEGYCAVDEGIWLAVPLEPVPYPYNTPFINFARIAPCPVIRNPIPQTRNFEMVLDPPAVDLNGDDIIDALDVELVRQAIVGLVAYDTRMDTNVNEKIDTQDLAAFKCAAES